MQGIPLPLPPPSLSCCKGAGSVARPISLGVLHFSVSSVGLELYHYLPPRTQPHLSLEPRALLRLMLERGLQRGGTAGVTRAHGQLIQLSCLSHCSTALILSLG